MIDRDSDKLIIFGKAIPMGGNMNTYGTVLRDASIVIMNPRVQGMPRKYVGDYYFQRKTQAVNVYNAPAPIWVSGRDQFISCVLRRQQNRGIKTR